MDKIIKADINHMGGPCYSVSTSAYDANSTTFLMTNIIFKAPNLNQKAWAVLEDSLCRYATGGYELYIVMGGYGTGGTGSAGHIYCCQMICVNPHIIFFSN